MDTNDDSTSRPLNTLTVEEIKSVYNHLRSEIRKCKRALKQNSDKYQSVVDRHAREANDYDRYGGRALVRMAERMHARSTFLLAEYRLKDAKQKLKADLLRAKREYYRRQDL